MTKLLEIRDKVIKFYGEYETYLFPAVKFLLAILAFTTINMNLGYSDKLTKLPIALVLALVCSLLPVNAILVISAAIILVDLYALSLEAAIIGLVLFLVIYFVYFRFAPKDGAAAILTPIFFKFNIPFVLPISVGLLREIYSIIGVACGTVLFYFLDGVRVNASILHVVANTDDKAANATSAAGNKLNLLIGQIVGNKEMYLVIGVFVVTAIVTNLIRRIKADHAWTLAIISGTLIQMLGLFLGYTWLGLTGKVAALMIGSILALIVGFVLQFLFMHLDYARTERVQFEDDSYYYYVKAVPKKMVASQEKTVKHFGNTASMGKRIERKAIVDELDIDEKNMD